ncbi:hypothetical protein ACFX11_013566 [Malus domestica]
MGHFRFLIRASGEKRLIVNFESVNEKHRKQLDILVRSQRHETEVKEIHKDKMAPRQQPHNLEHDQAVATLIDPMALDDQSPLVEVEDEPVV